MAISDLRLAPAATLLILSTGCGYLGSARDFDPGEFSRDPRWVRVGNVPLVLQRAEHDCGAATVAMVLAHWNRSLPFERLIEGLPKDYRQRYSTEDLKKLLEVHGLRARMIAGSQDILFAELSKGRPTIVGTGKVSIDGARPHFEVVVAYHPVENRVVTLDPARGWRENSLSGFLDEWDLARRTQIVAYEMQ